MTTTITSFSNKSVAKISRAVKKSESSPLRRSKQSNRRYNSSGGSSETQVFPFQTTMVKEDDTYTVTVGRGQVVLPDTQTLLDEYEFINPDNNTVYIYLKITGTQTVNGGWDSFNASIMHYDDEQENTDDINFFLISFIESNTINQQRSTTFDSGGRIY